MSTGRSAEFCCQAVFCIKADSAGLIPESRNLNALGQRLLRWSLTRGAAITGFDAIRGSAFLPQLFRCLGAPRVLAFRWDLLNPIADELHGLLVDNRRGEGRHSTGSEH